MCRRLGGLQGRSRRVRKISPPTGIRSSDRPVLKESLYRLSYPQGRLSLQNTEHVNVAVQLDLCQMSVSVPDLTTSHAGSSFTWFYSVFTEDVRDYFLRVLRGMLRFDMTRAYVSASCTL